jgi:hypothetical protein
MRSGTIIIRIKLPKVCRIETGGVFQHSDVMGCSLPLLVFIGKKVGEFSGPGWTNPRFPGGRLPTKLYS